LTAEELSAQRVEALVPATLHTYFLPSLKSIEEELKAKRERWVESGAWEQHDLSRQFRAKLKTHMYYHSREIRHADLQRDERVRLCG